ncbi:unnamed protein product, partial [Allacma fusca]
SDVAVFVTEFRFWVLDFLPVLHCSSLPHCDFNVTDESLIYPNR